MCRLFHFNCVACWGFVRVFSPSGNDRLTAAFAPIPGETKTWNRWLCNANCASSSQTALKKLSMAGQKKNSQLLSWNCAGVLDRLPSSNLTGIPPPGVDLNRSAVVHIDVRNKKWWYRNLWCYAKILVEEERRFQSSCVGGCWIM